MIPVCKGWSGMKNKKSLFQVIVLILVFLLAFSGCQRMSQTGKELENEDKENTEEAENTESRETDEKTDGGDEQEGYLAPIAVNQGFSILYGYADKNGKIVIEPQFKFAEPFYASGVAVIIDQNDKSGLIDNKGNYLIEPQYNFLTYSEGLFRAYNDVTGTTIAFDGKGNKKFEHTGYVFEFNDGLSPFYSDTERGYINKSGELVIKLDYEHLNPFFNGIAKVSETYMGDAYYIDTKGNDLTDKRSSGLRLYKDETNNMYGYKNSTGEIVIPAQYGEAEPFLDGYAIVNGSDSMFSPYYGVIDTQGNYVLEPVYCGIQRMKNGLVAVGEKMETGYAPQQYFWYSKKALFTPDMKEHTDWIYYSVDDFDEENVCVNDENSLLFINKDLKQAEKLPVFKGQGAFRKDNHLLRGEYNGLLTVADLKGNILTKSSSTTSLGDGITADRQVKSPSRPVTIAYPVISGLKDKSLQDKINSVIEQDMVNPYASLAIDNPDPYSIMVIDAEYSISRRNDLLLLDQSIYEYSLGAAHPMHYRNTLFIDLKTGDEYKLTDLFNNSPEVFDFLSAAASAQMKEKMEEVGYWEDHVTIQPDVGFAMAEGGIVLYFPEYELASYAAGMQEFFIPFTDLMSYIDTEGAFWKSFN